MTALRTLRRRVGTAAVLVGVLATGVLGTGTAYAVWSAYGTGTGTAAAATAQPLAVVLQASAALYPGASSAASLTFDNPNPFAVTVTSVTPGAVTVTGAAGCTAAGSAVAFAALTGSWTVPAGGKATATAPAAVSMGTGSDSACQGATFTAALTVAGQSS